MQSSECIAPKLSVVIPLFNEEEVLPELYRRVINALRALGETYEVIFINDGSRDRTCQLLDELEVVDPHLLCLHFSRNFGHQAAVSAGLDHARGQAVVVMDGDLQDPPEILEQLVAQWKEGHEVVYAVRSKRKERWLKRFSYFVFYRLLRQISDLDIPLDSGDFCLMDRAVVDALKALPERERFIRGLRSFVGFRQVGLTYERGAREGGAPKYTFRALVRLAMDGLLSFSSFPLTLIGCLALLGLLLPIAWGSWMLLAPDGISESGKSVGILLLLILGSIQLFSLAILAEYVRRIFSEVKQRPTYILDRRSKTSEPPPRIIATKIRVNNRRDSLDVASSDSS